GTDFDGWQIQAEGRTVQGELSRALRTLLREEVTVIGAGRTDAGTHALGQVAHLLTTGDLPIERIRRGLNGLLPPDVAVREAAEAPPGFHARYSARSKRYRYRIRTGKAALDRRQVWSIDHPLSLVAMQEAAACLAGPHDFGAFCCQDPVPASLRCRVDHCAWRTEGGELVFEIEADRFLRHMVRILVGTMVQVGGGRRVPESLPVLLTSGDRAQAGPTAPARGLCLLWVDYP
ncbi:MAG: tRNA pseudouridine(38-40) synthase TruA, partial [Candidatus Latescibacterota bacterium]